MPVALVALPVMWSHAMAATDVVTHVVAKEKQAAAVAHWTRARIAAAPAMQLQLDKGSGPVSLAELAREGTSGPSGSSPSGAADPSADQIAEMAYWSDWAVLNEEARALPLDDGAPLGTFGVYTSFDVNKQTQVWKVFPHKAMGKLTFSTGAGSASCSATSLSGNNFVTAAHCVFDTAANRFYSNWVFTPAYRNGTAPYGTFAATACTVLTAWVNLPGTYAISTHVKYDVAVCTAGKNSAAQTLNAAVGFLGRSWDQGYQQLIFDMGYPAKTYTGAPISVGPAQYLRACVAETFQYTTDTMGMGCDWGAGISGAPWVRVYKMFVAGASNYVNSVVSGGFSGQPNVYGIRFTSSNIVPICTARGC